MVDLSIVNVYQRVSQTIANSPLQTDCAHGPYRANHFRASPQLSMSSLLTNARLIDWFVVQYPWKGRLKTDIWNYHPNRMENHQISNQQHPTTIVTIVDTGWAMATVGIHMDPWSLIGSWRSCHHGTHQRWFWSSKSDLSSQWSWWLLMFPKVLGTQFHRFHGMLQKRLLGSAWIFLTLQLPFGKTPKVWTLASDSQLLRPLCRLSHLTSAIEPCRNGYLFLNPQDFDLKPPWNCVGKLPKNWSSRGFHVISKEDNSNYCRPSKQTVLQNACRSALSCLNGRDWKTNMGFF